MIIAIDESGSFDPSSKRLNFFVAAHIRQRKTLYKLKKEQFARWEKSLPRGLKNAKGEIKSSSLNDQQLEDFAASVIRPHYYIGITPISIRPSDNPPSVINNRRSAQMIGIRDGSQGYTDLGRPGPARTYQELGNWLDKLSYTQYLKLELLGACISSSLVNTVGHSISERYDDELVRIKFMIDRDFIREPRHHVFWRETLANQLYGLGRNDPLPLLDTWKKKGHPFLDKYAKSGRLNFNELFWEHCSFVDSSQHFEIRVADAVSTILSRYFNDRSCLGAFDLVRRYFLRDGGIHQLVLEDVDLSSYHYNREENPRGGCSGLDLSRELDRSRKE